MSSRILDKFQVPDNIRSPASTSTVAKYDSQSRLTSKSHSWNWSVSKTVVQTCPVKLNHTTYTTLFIILTYVKRKDSVSGAAAAPEKTGQSTKSTSKESCVSGSCSHVILQCPQSSQCCPQIGASCKWHKPRSAPISRMATQLEFSSMACNLQYLERLWRIIPERATWSAIAVRFSCSSEDSVQTCQSWLFA